MDQLLKVLHDHLGVLPELDEKILVSLDPLELPIITLKQKVEINLSIARELNADVLRTIMLVFHDNLHNQGLGVF